MLKSSEPIVPAPALHVMGGRQSSQNNHTRQQTSPSDANASRYSVGSLDNDTPVTGRAVLFSGPSANVELSGSNSSGGVVRRRRRRDRNDLFIETHSLPAHFFPTALLTADIKCPVCSKRIGSNEIESHLLVCLAKPKVSYNEDILTAAAGECIICFDDMCKGDRIARLQCLCIYHKHCLDEWFQRNRCCPEHPDQVPQEYIETLPRNSSRAMRPAISPRLSSTTIIDNDNEIINSPVANSLPVNLSVERSPILGIGNDSPSPSTSFTSPGEVGYSGHRNTHSNRASNRSDEGDSAMTMVHLDGDSPRTMVHVDEGSMHGTTSLFDEDEISQLTSKKLKILVSENSRSNELNNT